MGGVGFTRWVNGRERQVPAGDVAEIDFTGKATETETLRCRAPASRSLGTTNDNAGDNLGECRVEIARTGQIRR